MASSKQLFILKDEKCAEDQFGSVRSGTVVMLYQGVGIVPPQDQYLPP